MEENNETSNGEGDDNNEEILRRRREDRKGLSNFSCEARWLVNAHSHKVSSKQWVNFRQILKCTSLYCHMTVVQKD